MASTLHPSSLNAFDTFFEVQSGMDLYYSVYCYPIPSFSVTERGIDFPTCWESFSIKLFFAALFEMEISLYRINLIILNAVASKAAPKAVFFHICEYRRFSYFFFAHGKSDLLVQKSRLIGV